MNAQVFLHALQGHTGIHQIINQQYAAGQWTRGRGDAVGNVQLTTPCAGSLTVRAGGEYGERYLEKTGEDIAGT